MAAITMDRSNKPAPKGPQPLSPVLMLLAPLIALALPSAARRKLIARRDWTIEYYARRREAMQLRSQIAKEARLYRQIVIERLANLGYSWRPGARGDYSDEKARKRRKVAKVKIELTRYNESAIYFKLLVRSKKLFKPVSELPFRTYVSDLMSDETCNELSHALQRRVKSKHDDPTRGAWFVVYRNQVGGLLPKKVRYKAVLDKYPIDQIPKAPFILGVAENNTVLQASFEDFSHMLVCGSTKTGKSVFINGVISTAMRMTSPRDLQFVMIDPKQVELNFYEGCPHLYKPVVYELDDAIDTLREMRKTITERTKLMREARIKKLSDWNVAYPDQHMTRIVIVIEELASLWETSKQAAVVHRELEMISNMGRALGIHLIVCTQTPLKTVLPTKIKANFLLKVSGKTASTVESTLIIGTGDAAWLPGIPGRMVARIDTEKVEIQTPYIENADIDENLAIARGRVLGLIDLDGFEPVPNRDGIVHWLVKEHDGYLSPTNAHLTLKQYGLTLDQVRTLFEAIVRADRLQVAGQEYAAKREGKSWRLVEVTPAPLPEVEIDDEPATDQDATPSGWAAMLLAAALPVSEPPEIIELPRLPAPKPLPMLTAGPVLPLLVADLYFARRYCKRCSKALPIPTKKRGGRQAEYCSASCRVMASAERTGYYERMKQ